MVLVVVFVITFRKSSEKVRHLLLLRRRLFFPSFTLRLLWVGADEGKLNWNEKESDDGWMKTGVESEGSSFERKSPWRLC